MNIVIDLLRNSPARNLLVAASCRALLRTGLPFAFVLPLFFGGGCYSVEFTPVADYPALRRTDFRGAVEVTYERPAGDYFELGFAEVRDVDDPRSGDFLEFVEKQARRRGATGVWIRLDRMRVAPHNTFGSWFNPGGGIRIVPLVLFDRPAN